MPSLSLPALLHAWRRSRPWLAVLVLTYGTYRFGVRADKFLPWEGWTLWRFLVIWAATLAWWLGLMVSGRLLLTRVVRVSLPAPEQQVVSFALGFTAFHLLFSLFGFLGQINAVTYYLTPVLLIGVGAHPYLLALMSRWRHPLPRPPWSLARAAVLAFGTVGLALIYFPILGRSHIGFDSAWYHVPIAEHYVAAGGIVPFREGWYLGAYPHLTSIVDTWGLLTPGLSFADRLILLNHLEFVIFVMTLVGVAALAIRIGRNNGLGLAWAACFAFPTLYLHDLQLAADHVAAFWFAPMYLGLFRAWRDLNPRFVALVALSAAGALDVKYTAFPGVAAPALALVGRALWLGARERRWRRTGESLGLAAGVGLALTSPYWLKNWIYYGDPIYPLLHKVLKEKVWHQDAAVITEAYLNHVGTFPAPRTWAGVVESIQATFTFSGTAYEFYEYHRDVPYFGALFTLASLAMPFLPVGKRVWGLLACLQVTLFLWYFQSHVDRYLQAFLPGMAALIAVVARAAWRKWPTRLALIGTIGFQLAWGSAVFGLSAQVEKYKDALATLSSSYDGTQNKPTPALEAWIGVGKRLPRRAVVLVHDTYWHVGLGRRSVNDWVGLQGGLNYGRMSSSKELVQALKRLGVTHLTWVSSPMGDDSLSGDFRFLELAETLSIDKQTVSYVHVAKLPDEVPPTGEEWVLVQGCQDSYAPGLYRFASTAVPTLRGVTGARLPPPEVRLTNDNAEELVGRAKFALTRSGCNQSAENEIRKSFRSIGTRAGATLWLRK